MVVVAASGGGAKAAYWTGLVVDCLFGGGPPTAAAKECPPPQERDLYGRLFLTSSVSGGSIGVYHMLQDRQRSDDWVDTSNGREVLSPVLGWGVFHDLPALMLGMLTDPRDCDGGWSCRRGADRALVQEARSPVRRESTHPTASRCWSQPSRACRSRSSMPPQDGAERRVLLSPVLLDTRRRRSDELLRTGTAPARPRGPRRPRSLAGSPMPDPAAGCPARDRRAHERAVHGGGAGRTARRRRLSGQGRRLFGGGDVRGAPRRRVRGEHRRA